ncbi:MAG: STAS domain-containing protein [Chloroflexi bacterium]|nr:STAS domain-containing protein [Chloroflexota bacterium]
MATFDLADAHRKLASGATSATDATAAPVATALVTELQRKGLRLEAVAGSSGRLVLRLEGKLSAATAPLLKKVIEQGERARQIDIDLAGLAQADGVGLAVLVRLASLVADAGGALRIVNPTAALRVMMTRIHLHHLIDIVEPAPGEDIAAR